LPLGTRLVLALLAPLEEVAHKQTLEHGGEGDER
jgi:hypothetical protein